MGSQLAKIWKISLLYFVVVLLVCLVLFEATLNHNKKELYKEQRMTAQVNIESLVEPSTFLKIASSILLLPEVYIYKDNAVVVADLTQSQATVIPLETLLYNALSSSITPILALWVVVLISIICTTLININKYNVKLKPACQKVDSLLKSLDNNYKEYQTEDASAYLNIALDALAEKTTVYHTQIEENILCDKLTKLLERHAFLEHISEQMNISSQKKKKCGLLFIDLDGFKQVNDSFGHSFGDEVLIQVSERLRTIVRHQHLNFNESSSELEYNLARLGGDEFTIFIQELESSEGAISIAKNILQELERDFILGNKNIKISASIGIAVYPDSAETPNALLQMADVAMYRAKSEGRGYYRIYSPEMGNKVRRYHYLLEEMRTAIDANSFTLNFQPIIHVDGCEISYFEALIRWQHPTEGQITPSEFIPIAEDSNLILELGDWILDEACRQMASWYHAGMNKARISVNVSGVQLKYRSLYEWIMTAINKFGLPANSLMIEITETCFIDASDDIILQLQKLRDEGVMVAIDDFGTGFSSLSLLANLPVDILKIDRLFISQAMRNNKYKKILHSIVDMAAQLELKVVAEGIEQVEQFELLKSLGVVYIQGYFISRPQQSHYVGKKVFHQNTSILAQTGTSVWTPEPSRAIGIY